MAQKFSEIRSRPKHGMFIRLVKTWADLDDSRALTELVLEQRGFEDYDLTVTFGEKALPRDEIKQKGGRIVIPIGGRDFRRIPLDPVDDAELIAAGKTHRSSYDITVAVVVPSDLRGRSNLDNRLLWLLDRERYMMAKLGTLHAVHDQVLARRLQSEYGNAAQHFKRLYAKYQGGPIERPVMMADYSATGLLTWIADGNASESGTWASGDSVCFGAGKYSAGTLGSTVDGTAHDDAAQIDDDVDDEGAFVSIHGDPTTGSSVTNATTGFSAGDENIGCAFAVTTVDVTEVEATGFPDTQTSLASDPTVALTTATDDLAICAYGAFTFDSGAPATTPNTGDTVIFEDIDEPDDEMGYIAYEKATGASTTVGVAFPAEGNFEGLVGAVVPTGSGDITAATGPASIPIVAPAPTVEHNRSIEAAVARIRLVAVAAAAVTVPLAWTQTHYQWLEDDAAEGANTAIGAEDAPTSRDKEDQLRLRIQVDSDADAPSVTRTWKYRKKGSGDDWRDIPVKPS